MKRLQNLLTFARKFSSDVASLSHAKSYCNDLVKLSCNWRFPLTLTALEELITMDTWLVCLCPLMKAAKLQLHYEH
jgi:hypothetical protein